MTIRTILLVMLLSTAAFSQMPKIEPGVSQELAKWRATHYSDVRYKLNLTLEKMSPVLKGTIEIRVNVSPLPKGTSFGNVFRKDAGPSMTPIVLDWRKIKGFEERSIISSVSLNGRAMVQSASFSSFSDGERDKSRTLSYSEHNEHLIFSDGLVAGENVIKLDFTSPILPSGSAITRYVDKEDGSEYIYSLFVPSDASTAFPVFDQPDLKARFKLSVTNPDDWTVISNTRGEDVVSQTRKSNTPNLTHGTEFSETKPISTYVFSIAAGNFASWNECAFYPQSFKELGCVSDAVTPYQQGTTVYVRKSQSGKFRPHATEVFRLNREAVKYFEEYFDYKFPFPKYDLVLIPEFPFGGMEHAGATFLREASVIFPQEPTKNDHINRATLIFHEAAHQWFGDTVTMRWFDDLWLKEGFATFTAYKALEKIMPEMNAWKVFYERVKQGAYQTDSTRGTTPIYQEIPNLSAAKSAYGNIVYNKAPAFLRQAEFYLGEDKFRAAVRSFLKKHEFGNAGWEDLVKEFEIATKFSEGRVLNWARTWVRNPGLGTMSVRESQSMKSLGGIHKFYGMDQLTQDASTDWEVAHRAVWRQKLKVLAIKGNGKRMNFDFAFDVGLGRRVDDGRFGKTLVINEKNGRHLSGDDNPVFIFPNYGDYGYGIFLLDEMSRDYVLKNIQNETEPFLRSMMWGALWDSVREGELDPREYVELVVRVLMQKPDREGGLNAQPSSQALANARASAIEDESTTALLLSRVGTALNYYIDEPAMQRPDREGGRDGRVGSKALASARASASDLRNRVEDMLIAGMRGAETQGQRITYYRAFLNVAGSENARGVLKSMLTAEEQRRGGNEGGNQSGSEGVPSQRDASGREDTLHTGRVSPLAVSSIPLKTKDKFDIVTRLLILDDPEAPKLLAGLEKTETSDDAKRYAYAAKAGIATAENKAKYWKDFTENKDISESWIEAAFGPWNSIRHSDLTLPYLERALKELPNHKRNRKIFFVNGWLGAFIGGQRSEEALAIVNKFLADNPNLDRDLRLKILENVDIIERAVNIRKKHDR